MRGIRATAELMLKDAARGNGADLEQRLGFVVEGARRIDALVDGLVAYAVALQTVPASFQSAKLDVLLRAALGSAAATT